MRVFRIKRTDYYHHVHMAASTTELEQLHILRAVIVQKGSQLMELIRGLDWSQVGDLPWTTASSLEVKATESNLIGLTKINYPNAEPDQARVMEVIHSVKRLDPTGLLGLQAALFEAATREFGLERVWVQTMWDQTGANPQEVEHADDSTDPDSDDVDD
ncbi:hypothetical protein [Caudoviricetes sp.]|nr:hypothetical protein [Caudoviricetes sp.]UOF81875.1 hypothetical protein [Caudoviricetes sp.]